MPTRTVVQEFCDVCFAEDNETEVSAIEKLRFGWQDREFQLLVCAEHADPIRDELQRLSELASPADGRRRTTGAARQTRAVAPAPAKPTKTLFSQLSGSEKERFRAWAEMPNARRISDARVKEWIEAGKP
jgi:hypothetical protein